MAKNLDNKTSTLLDSIRANASQEYQDRIPLAEQTSIAELGSSILSSKSLMNEFVVALVNKVAMTIIREKRATNPLNVFKGEQLTFGEKVEDIYIPLVQAQVFDQKTAESELYKREIPEISVLYHHINRKGFYKTTTDRRTLQKGFTSERAFGQLVRGIVDQLNKSRLKDEFLVYKSLITQAVTEGKVYEVVSAPISDEATAKALLEEIKAISTLLPILSTKYNHAGVDTDTPQERIKIIMDARTEAQLTVQVLAGAFNMSEVDYRASRVLIDNFEKLGNSIHCIICDADWFVLHDYPDQMDDLYNPQGQYTNHFLHYESINSTTHFANAVVIKKVASTLVSIDLLPATASIDPTLSDTNTIQFRVEATGTNNPSSKVKYTISGETSEDTFISTTGLLYVAPDETGTAGEITVTATSEQDELITDTSTVTIV